MQRLYLSSGLRGGITREGQPRFCVPHSHPEDGKVPVDRSLDFHFPEKSVINVLQEYSPYFNAKLPRAGMKCLSIAGTFGISVFCFVRF